MGLAAMFELRSAAAGPWSAEPSVGVSTDYATNPQLLVANGRAERHVAGLVDVPLRLESDEFTCLLEPSGRITDAQGYTSLASNYEHVDSLAQWSAERSALSLKAGWARDSSLYFGGALGSGIGVRRDTVTGGASLTHALSELDNLRVDGSWQRVRYAEPAGGRFLVDYRYVDIGPTFSAALTERDTFKILGNLSRYQSLDGITESSTTNLEVGPERELTEAWHVSAIAGYSRSVNRQKIIFGPFFLGVARSQQDAAVYSTTITRRGERWNLNGSVARAQQPTGFAFLSRQDSVDLNAAYTRSERWDYGVGAAWLKAATPTFRSRSVPGADNIVRYGNLRFTANWHWTPQWTISLHAAYFNRRYGPPSVGASSTSISADLVHHFLRTPL